MTDTLSEELEVIDIDALMETDDFNIFPGTNSSTNIILV